MRSNNNTRQPTLRATLTACAFWVAACGVPEAEDPFVPIYETERLRIGTSFGTGLCLGHINMWEAHLDVIEQTLGVSRDFAWLFVYLEAETRQIAADCEWDDNTDLTGCWRDPVARATFTLVPHELVHAWNATVQPRALPALSEGIAVRMTGHVQRVGTQEFTVDDLLLSKFPSAKYPKAGHFVAWLLATYGPESFMALYTRTSRGMTPAEVSAAFRAVLGKAPEDLLLAYETAAKAYYPAMGGAACGKGPVIPWQGDAATWPAEGSCSEGPFFGFEDSPWWQRVTIDVSAPGTYLLDTDGREASLIRCLTTPADEFELPKLPELATGDWQHTIPMDGLFHSFGSGPGEDWADHPLELDAGIYEVWVERRWSEISGLNSEMSLLKL